MSTLSNKASYEVSGLTYEAKSRVANLCAMQFYFCVVCWRRQHHLKNVYCAVPCAMCRVFLRDRVYFLHSFVGGVVALGMLL